MRHRYRTVTQNQRGHNFRAVAKQYTVIAKALNNKTEKSVGLRTKPTKSSKEIRRLYAGDELIVPAEGRTWLQVKDMRTGRTGYVAKDYIEL